MNESDLDEMAIGYMECSLFTDLPDGEVGQGEFDCTPYLPNFSEQAKESAAIACAQFFSYNVTDLAEVDARRAGNDLWYTRNGHGTGFWDRDEIEESARKRLADAARKMGERHLVRGDDGKFYYE